MMAKTVPHITSRLSRARTARFSTSSRSFGYADTLPNLKIGAHTKVLYQGFTGRQATANAKESLKWGTKIVGGVKPGVEGEHLDLPIFPSVRVAKEKSNPDASAIYVPGNQTAQAIEEAIEAEIPLVVAVAEHVPVHDMLRIHSILQTQSKTRLVGANCPGIISAVGKCRIGFQPLPCFTPGRIGVVAKSGTLSYETVGSLTRAGLGQSLCISMGGDVLAGTNFVDALKVFEDDPDTDGIVLIGEIGGTAEMDAAEWIKDYHKRTTKPKPIMALVGGLEAPKGRVMGHAGAWVAPGEPDARAKYEALQKAGVTLVSHPEKFGPGMKELLKDTGRLSNSSLSSASAGQRRGFHTVRRARVTVWPAQRRSLYIKQHEAFDMLEEAKVQTQTKQASPDDFHLSITVDRTSLSPCVAVSSGNQSLKSSLRIPFNYTNPAFSRAADNTIQSEIVSFLGYSDECQETVGKYLQQLYKIFRDNEAFVLETRASFSPDKEVVVHDARFGFDDAAHKSSGRHEKLHQLRDIAAEVPEEVRAENSGIVYIKLEGEGSIGTLVNGAGLAMNTVDVLILKGGKPANFLDTGGKATAATVKECFSILCEDARVNTIFVNIFGGLTRCDMIAEGIMDAFRELDMKVPVVVRLRGTNEEKGQKLIAESGLPLHAFDSFDEAADKAIRFARAEAS
ncbi:succinyl-CoA synthetase subunit alpha, putative [Talaromyces stipitatus ATCC 10500]|uniref:Succinyl-CoA synthetase subunit alpha, putative n=1 Tax=Talaromyces stipitatus (strain ATCC 10500 / CBS 375.48 / QM 6759 / NRRL 1006) TaxID=441959 RepID=B8LVL0_TALSN|nr:succinyl-CoA synthetase subunit alpha, putative [Talaromyces stipitatus ATCC 10500]EED24140.1 succinyl-CoA synthetase subunit alpha, putative [Talaromyces stipitatus ATCC 10500]